MNEQIKEWCLRILESPSDASALNGLIKAIKREDPSLAASLHDFVERGTTEPLGHTLGGEMKELVKVQYVVVRAIPFKIAVRFAYECAMKVLPAIETAYASAHGFRELLVQVSSWAEGKVTKKSVREKLHEVQKIAVRLSQEWHTAYGEGRFNSLSKRDFDQTNVPLIAFDAVLAAAGSVIARPDSALACVDEAAMRCIEAESTVGNGHIRDAVMRWQLDRLKYLINEFA